MPHSLRSFLSVESLEARETPTVYVGVNLGTLFVRGDNTDTEVVITELVPGSFDVTINGISKGTFALKNVVANFGSGNDTFDLGVNTSLPGGLTVNFGGGNDSFTSANSTIGAKVTGNVMIN